MRYEQLRTALPFSERLQEPHKEGHDHGDERRDHTERVPTECPGTGLKRHGYAADPARLWLLTNDGSSGG